MTTAFAQSMALLAEAFGASLSDARLVVYWELLRDVPEHELRRAVLGVCREADARFLPADPELRLPPPSTILRYVRPSEEDAAVLAWAAVRRAVEDVGPHMPITFDDGCVAGAVRSAFGDWPSCCAYDEGPALATKRQEFLTAYKAARRASSRRPVRMLGSCGDVRLAGTWEARVMASGEAVVEPARLRLPAAPPKALGE